MGRGSDECNRQLDAMEAAQRRQGDVLAELLRRTTPTSPPTPDRAGQGPTRRLPDTDKTVKLKTNDAGGVALAPPTMHPGYHKDQGAFVVAAG